MTARIVWTEIKLLGREPITLLMSLAFPALLLVLLAGSFGNEPDPEMGGIGGVDFYVPVYAAAAIAVMGFLGVPTHLAAYRERGVLRRFRAAGVSAWPLAGAQIIVTALMAAVAAALMIAIGFGGYDLNAPSSALGVLAGFLVGTLAFAALGVLLGTLLPTARAAQGVGLLLFFGLFFIAGGGPPPYLLPDALNTAVDFTPMGPLMDAVGDPWHGAGFNPTAVAVLLGMAVVATLLAVRRLART
ncbi:ABC transporter permease [Micromonospora sp. NPDC049175]|uniref:ABC transporter permease n=1 Tax=Micromonospora sp. NPDC049175 TaxID=3364266 RepID=UPI0037249241